jgi:hypothetical protein
MERWREAEWNVALIWVPFQVGLCATDTEVARGAGAFVASPASFLRGMAAAVGRPLVSVKHGFTHYGVNERWVDITVGQDEFRFTKDFAANIAELGNTLLQRYGLEVWQALAPVVIKQVSQVLVCRDFHNLVVNADAWARGLPKQRHQVLLYQALGGPPRPLKTPTPVAHVRALLLQVLGDEEVNLYTDLVPGTSSTLWKSSFRPWNTPNLPAMWLLAMAQRCWSWQQFCPEHWFAVHDMSKTLWLLLGHKPEDLQDCRYASLATPERLAWPRLWDILVHQGAPDEAYAPTDLASSWRPARHAWAACGSPGSPGSAPSGASRSHARRKGRGRL